MHAHPYLVPYHPYHPPITLIAPITFLPRRSISVGHVASLCIVRVVLCNTCVLVSEGVDYELVAFDKIRVERNWGGGGYYVIAAVIAQDGSLSVCRASIRWCCGWMGMQDVICSIDYMFL